MFLSLKKPWVHRRWFNLNNPTFRSCLSGLLNHKECTDTVRILQLGAGKY